MGKENCTCNSCTNVLLWKFIIYSHWNLKSIPVFGWENRLGISGAATAEDFDILFTVFWLNLFALSSLLLRCWSSEIEWAQSFTSVFSQPKARSITPKRHEPLLISMSVSLFKYFPNLTFVLTLIQASHVCGTQGWRTQVWRELLWMDRKEQWDEITWKINKTTRLCRLKQ